MNLSQGILLRFQLCTRCLIAWKQSSKVFTRAVATQASSADSNSKSRENAVKLAYSSFVPTGPLVEQPPILVIHGLFGSKRNWLSLGKAISMKSGRKVIAVDTRNHGESPHVPEMDYSLMCQDVLALMDDLKIGKCVLIGHSMGGKIAMTVALTEPTMVDKLIVEDVSPDVSRHAGSTAFPVYIEAMKNVVFDHSQPSVTEARRYVDEQLQYIFPEKELRAFVLTNVERTEKGYRWKVNMNAIADNLQSIVAFPNMETCYYGDTLFIGGGKSDHIKASDHPAIRKLFPEARIETIPGAGHWVHAQEPHLFMDMVLSFLGQTS